MKELSVEQMNDVNGGMEPVLTAFAVGFLIGMIYELFN